MSSSTLEAPTPWHVWWLAIRPRTLPAAVAPVMVGCGLASAIHQWAPGPAAAALVGALLLQIGANLSNDYFDYMKGADTETRVGPTRVTQAGLVSPIRMVAATALVFALAFVVGAYLTWVGGWQIIAIGLAAIATALAYTGGPFPLAYLGLGEVAACLFFGPVAVLGTLFVQTHAISQPAAWLAVGPGLLSAAILGVNNLRDREPDAACGKRTLAVRFGPRAARALYATELLAAFAIPLVVVALHAASPWILLVLAALPFAVGPARLVAKAQGAALNEGLAGTARLMFIYGALLAAGLVL